MVGSINHKLKIRGAKNLKTASSNLVKGKGLKLTQGQTMDKKFVKMTQKDGELPKIILAWEKKQKELKEQGLEDKEIANIAVDKRRNSDLAILRLEGGPFTSPEEVTSYVAKTDISDAEKNKRLYLEVNITFAVIDTVSIPLVHCQYVISLSAPCQELLSLLSQGVRAVPTEEKPQKSGQ